MRFRRFSDRREAGRALAAELAPWAGRPDLLVLALPRGGVPVGHEVARALGAPLDVYLVRKLGVPGHEELAMGAIASGGEPILNDETVRMLRIPAREIERVIAEERAELERREREYRADRPPHDMAGRTVILVDDGLATGSTMRAAAIAVRAGGPARVIIAAPVASIDACEMVRDVADEVVAVLLPEPFYAVGAWYADFTQTTDDEVRALLKE